MTNSPILPAPPLTPLTPALPLTPAPPAQAPGRLPWRRRPAAAFGWLRRNLFGSWSSALVTLAIVWGLGEVVPPLFRWLVTDSVLGPADPRTCLGAGGACWAFIHEKYRLILFGLYPYDQQWRPLLVILIIIALLAGSCDRRLWRRWLAPMWAAGMAAIGVLMWGGVFGLPKVETWRWGGLPLTLLLSVVGLAVAFPFAIALALGRRSTLPIIRALSVAYIELIRGVPLVSLLFMASVMLPLFLPTGVSIDKLLRAQIAMILFAAAYLAEVIRGGLQAIPRGQYEAAASLGLSYGQKVRLIILPQALTIVIPPIVNTFIAFFKDTSLVIIIGIYDLTTAAKAALDDAAWRGSYREAYLFIGVIYFGFSFFMSRYSQWLEKDLGRGART